jgi:hypothetical protein
MMELISFKDKKLILVRSIINISLKENGRQKNEIKKQQEA